MPCDLDRVIDYQLYLATQECIAPYLRARRSSNAVTGTSGTRMGTGSGSTATNTSPVAHVIGGSSDGRRPSSLGSLLSPWAASLGGGGSGVEEAAHPPARQSPTYEGISPVVPSSTGPARGPPGTRQDPNRLPTVTGITLLVEDLPLTRRFYERVFCVGPTREDAHSAAFSFNGGALAVILCVSSDASEHRLLGRGVHAGRVRDVARRFQLRVAVESVDEVYARLRRLEEGEGWPLVVGGLTRPRLGPWGVRTVTFQDPAGHCWEVSEETC
ncbi:hypothetical protein VSDG_05237 [Cytospora chrysosperma]|uniref:VOC domain-containing protein n=1 Tax=Cytospora chrysosperma TaxID=252740 RepID=A0A423VY03_CYTCH|nr:hypothetical protein VSDG_05237 [Valsa sordida]